jgi:phosphoribosylamine--glycine ligase
MASKNILVIGGGGREHALCATLSASPSVSKVFAIPGNAGISQEWFCPTHQGKNGSILEIVDRFKIDLVVVGPEGPLVEGVVDQLYQHGVPAFGPTGLAARLEGSKAFMKKFATDYKIPTAPCYIFSELSIAQDYVLKHDKPLVIKADGLCAGKGVILPESVSEALKTIEMLLGQRMFGAASTPVIIEDRLYGTELSIQAVCDGENMILLPAAQDHKRVGDGDMGPNTGGMGAYAPVHILTPQLEKKIRERIMVPTLMGMRDRGHPFRGVLYAGLMISPDGDPSLLEFNVRFGDPEAQVVLPLLQGDFAEACYACALGNLQEGMLQVKKRNALCVILASHGYPSHVRTGDRIDGLDTVVRMQDVIVYHAATRVIGNDLVTSGGRVLGVVGLGDSLTNARDRAYLACSQIRFEGMHYRKDIGARALTVVNP